MPTAKRLPKNDATFCRLKGWGVGTVLSIDVDAYAGQVFQWRYRITAIGEAAILVRQVYDNGRERPEESWTRTLINRLVLAATPGP